MTYFLIIAVVACIILAIHSITGMARLKAARMATEAVLRDLEFYMTLSGHVRKHKDMPVWGKFLNPHTMTYKVVVHATTGKVTIHCTQLTQKGATGRECSLTLEGSGFKLADTLDMQAQARKFVGDCARDYMPPFTQGMEGNLLSFLDKLTFAPRRK